MHIYVNACNSTRSWRLYEHIRDQQWKWTLGEKALAKLNLHQQLARRSTHHTEPHPHPIETDSAPHPDKLLLFSNLSGKMYTIWTSLGHDHNYVSTFVCVCVCVCVCVYVCVCVFQPPNPFREDLNKLQSFESSLDKETKDLHAIFEQLDKINSGGVCHTANGISTSGWWVK